MLSWPWLGPDRESQIRDETHGLTGARSGCPGFDRAVIMDWWGLIRPCVSLPILAMSSDLRTSNKKTFIRVKLTAN